MPITISGMASGLDTNDIIEKLVNVEAKPIEQWVSDKENSRKRKDALGVLKSHLSKLNDSAKKLYDLEPPTMIKKQYRPTKIFYRPLQTKLLKMV